MDRQQADFRRSLEGSGVMVRRNGDQIVLIMPSDVTFAVDKSEVQPQFTRVLDDVARTLNAYPQTTIDVVGHADSSGPDDYNQTLSERRASSVAGYLTGPGRVIADRVFVAGQGERQPIAVQRHRRRPRPEPPGGDHPAAADEVGVRRRGSVAHPPLTDRFAVVFPRGGGGEAAEVGAVHITAAPRLA